MLENIKLNQWYVDNEFSIYYAELQKEVFQIKGEKK